MPGVDDQQRRAVVVVEEMVVGVDQLGQILLGELPLEGALPAADPCHAGGDVGGEVDDQIGARHLRLERRVELLVEHQLVVGERQVGEDPVLLEAVVGHQELLEELALHRLLLLLEPLEDEVELGLEGRARTVLVEVGEERVVDVLEHAHRLEPAGDQVDERRLADPDRAVDRDVAVRERVGQGSVQRSRDGVGEASTGRPVRRRGGPAGRGCRARPVRSRPPARSARARRGSAAGPSPLRPCGRSSPRPPCRRDRRRQS